MTQTVFEDGAVDALSVALFVVDSRVDKTIWKWLENGRSTGTYAELKGLPGARRLARIDGLSLVQKAPSPGR